MRPTGQDPAASLRTTTFSNEGEARQTRSGKCAAQPGDELGSPVAQGERERLVV
jgi:hypothetical protein